MTNPHQGQYIQLALAMGKTGILGYGGGPSVIPLIRHEVVTHYKWLSDEEFAEILAIANALPGPIATKMAAYLGYRQKGVFGSILAVIVHILPSVVAMICLLTFVDFLSNSPVVQGMIAAVLPVIAVMLGVMGYEFAKRAYKGLGKWLVLFFCGIAFIMLQLIPLHPAIVIVIFLGYGVLHYRVIHMAKQKNIPEPGPRKEEGPSS